MIYYGKWHINGVVDWPTDPKFKARTIVEVRKELEAMKSLGLDILLARLEDNTKTRWPDVGYIRSVGFDDSVVHLHCLTLMFNIPKIKLI